MDQPSPLPPDVDMESAPRAAPATFTQEQVLQMMQMMQSQLQPRALREDHVRSEKTPDVPEYDGKGGAAALDAFATALKMKFKLSADRFPTPAMRINYVYSRARGEAQEILTELINDETEMADWAAAVDHLRLAFDDPDPEYAAARKLLAVRQASRPFREFYIEFRQHARRVPVNTEFMKHLLRNALSRELTAQVAHRDVRYLTYEQLVEECQRLDPIARQTTLPPRAQLARSTPRPAVAAAAPAVAPASTSAAPTARDPDAMDLDAKRLQREQRRKDGLCFYCGKPGHRARECPVAPGDRVPKAKANDMGFNRITELNEDWSDSEGGTAIGDGGQSFL
jgi:hypothetical protein